MPCSCQVQGRLTPLTHGSRTDWGLWQRPGPLGGQSDQDRAQVHAHTPPHASYRLGHLITLSGRDARCPVTPESGRWTPVVPPSGRSLRDQIFFFLLRTALKDRPKGPPTANRQLPSTANHQPQPTASHQPLPTASGDQPPTANHCQPPPTTNHQPPTAANHHLPPPTPSCQLPTVNRRQPPTANRHQPWLSTWSARGLFWENWYWTTFFFPVKDRPGHHAIKSAVAVRQVAGTPSLQAALSCGVLPVCTVLMHHGGDWSATVRTAPHRWSPWAKIPPRYVPLWCDTTLSLLFL